MCWPASRRRRWCSTSTGLAQIRARKRWSVRLGLALAPDERTILLDTPIGRLSFTNQAQDEAESDIGASV